MGCLRLHGTAKAIDLTTLMCEVRWLRRQWDEHAEFLENALLGVTRAHKQSNRGSASTTPLEAVSQCIDREVKTEA